MAKFLAVSAVVFGLTLMAPLAASAQIVHLSATLTGDNESPGVLTGAAGSAEITLDVDAREMKVTLKAFNLPTTSTASHIHVGGKGLAGPVVVNFPITTGVTGDITQTFRVGTAAFVARPAMGINTIDDVIQAMLNGNAYVNVHTTANGGGEIRGQLEVVD